MENTATSLQKEATLADVMVSVWRLKWFVLLGGLIGALIAYILLLNAVPRYKAEMLVAPPEQNAASIPADIAAMLSGSYGEGITALPAFKDMGGAGSLETGRSEFRQFEALLRGPTVAQQLLTIQGKGLEGAVQKDVLFRFIEKKPVKTPEGVAGYLRKAVKIESAGPGAIQKISYSHPDRDQAVKMLVSMTEETDRLIHQKAKAENERRLAYLRTALEGASHPDHRRILTSLLMKQEYLKMMLAMDGAYAVNIIEPPAATVKPDWPDEKLFYGLLVLVGLFLGYGMGGAAVALCRKS